MKSILMWLFNFITGRPTQKWIVSDCYNWPKLEENSIHAVIDTNGFQRKARFEMSPDEYWWRDAKSNKEIVPLCYMKN